MSLFPSPLPLDTSPADRLRARLQTGHLVQAPGCYDALSARILEAAGFSVGFLGGFSVAAARLGLPDMGLLSYGEMIEQARNVCAATALPIIGDADTGYGNAINAQRTLQGCAQAGLAGMMIEDQQWPKRCGHTRGKEIVDRGEALRRVRACVRAKEEYGIDLVIMARTDACATDGFDEALWRAEAFADAGAEITFLEAPEDLDQMKTYCERVPGWKTANMVEDGKTPWLGPEALEDIGYALAIYPVSLLLQSIRAMQEASRQIASSGLTDGPRASFDEARAILGWSTYEEHLERLESESPSETPPKGNSNT